MSVPLAFTVSADARRRGPQRSRLGMAEHRAGRCRRRRRPGAARGRRARRRAAAARSRSGSNATTSASRIVAVGALHLRAGLARDDVGVGDDEVGRRPRSRSPTGSGRTPGPAPSPSSAPRAPRRAGSRPLSGTGPTSVGPDDGANTSGNGPSATRRPSFTACGGGSGAYSSITCTISESRAARAGQPDVFASAGVMSQTATSTPSTPTTAPPTRSLRCTSAVAGRRRRARHRARARGPRRPWTARG